MFNELSFLVFFLLHGRVQSVVLHQLVIKLAVRRLLQSILGNTSTILGELQVFVMGRSNLAFVLRT